MLMVFLLMRNHQLLLGVLTIGPWALLILYDLVLWIVRAIYYEIPYIGGRARGKRRPRAPSLAERPSGQPRRFSLGGPPVTGSEHAPKDGVKARLLVGDVSEDPASIADRD